MSNNIVIVAAKRTPIGAFQGAYSNITAPVLASKVIENIFSNLKIFDKNLVSEVLMGCVLPAGLGQAPARQSALYGGLNTSVPCTTVNKMCGSGLKTIVQACNNIFVDNHKIILAGGMENMTLSPYILPKARAGYRLGHGVVKDHMFLDGLEDVYNKNKLMGHFAEATAKKYNFTRELQDEFAILSAKRSIESVTENKFADELVSVNYTNRGKEVVVEQDETPSKINIDKISKLKPAFDNNGTVTAANSSSISDGAAAVLLMTESRANELGLKPLAKILDYTEVAQEPEWFTTAPVLAIQKLYSQLKDRYNLDKSNIDLYEINEAFAVVTMAAIHDLNLAHDQVNILGGACSLGHPIGATGSRIIVTLLNALRQNNKQFGIASLCIGGGEALAIGLEIL